MTNLNLSKVIKSFFLVVLGAIALFVIYILIALNWSYSTGERAGFLQKVSNKGWICKTWEGELSLVAMPGAAPDFIKNAFTPRIRSMTTTINYIKYSPML